MVKIDKLEFVQIVQCRPLPLVHIIQCLCSGFGGRLQRELCLEYRNIGEIRKARQRLANGLISVFLFYVLAVLPFLAPSVPRYGLFSASAYSLTFFFCLRRVGLAMPSRQASARLLRQSTEQKYHYQHFFQNILLEWW